MSIYQKLHMVQAATRSLAADAQGQTGAKMYPYVSGAKLLSVIRPTMDKVGLILSQEIVGIENVPTTYATSKGEKTEMFTCIHMVFTWIDAEDGSTLRSEFYANGMNAWDKGLGSALTYGERYFLMKFFHIATDEDDVDALVRTDITESAHQASNPVADAIAEVNAATDGDTLKAVWNKYKAQLGKNVEFVKAIRNHPSNPKKGRTNA